MAIKPEGMAAGSTQHGDAAAEPNPRRRGIRGVLSLPLAVVSTVAVTLGIVQPAEAAAQPLKRQAKAKAQTGGTVRATAAAASTPPSEYVVVDGDTVSSVAERFGLATAEVLAFNGLGWSSLIFPGQRLALPGGVPAEAVAPVPTAAPEITKHVVVEGETVSGIAATYGLDVASVLSANGLAASSLIFPGEAIVLPLPGVPAPPAQPVEQTPPPTGAPPPAPAADGSHVVVAGDTLSGIAAEYGVTVAELDAANGLGGSTLILPGQVLALRAAPVAVVTVASVDVPLTEEMRGNAQIIVDVGRALGVPDQGIVVALAAAAQESGLRNVRHGDRDSLGLFQQRPSQGWGTAEQVLDPVRAAAAFFGGSANPNPGRTIGLLDVAGWESLTVSQAAQTVQRSAFPDHYAKWEASARAWLSELG
jgi:LysM repeat protein